jgi:hypothetical protein
VKKNNWLTLTTILLTSTASAAPKIPVPYTSFDGGVISAETLGRGETVASNRGTPASGSENPAALNTSFTSSLYTTAGVGVTSKIPRTDRRAIDPLHEKVLQYAAIGAEKGVMFFEPISRLEESTTAQLSVDAIGFAGADNWRNGSFGISFAYLRSSLYRPLTASNLPGEGADTGNGVRLNIGVRYPTGPAMWGLVLQNFPGFLWWKHHEKTQLPMRVRMGNTWKIRKGILSTVEWDQRYYNEGTDKEDFLHIGAETQISDAIFLRAGVFANDIQKPEERHWTTGLTIHTDMGAEVTYALERFELSGEKVSKSFISMTIPFASTDSSQ